jgi:hypothetical protein
MKQLIILASMCLAVGIMLTGCNKSSSNPVSGGTGSIDQNLVGVWWDAAAGNGTEVKSDGTGLQLTAYAGKIAYDTLFAKSYTIKITASGGSGTFATTGPVAVGGKDTTISHAFTYTLSADKNTLTINSTDDAGKPTTSTNVKKSIGADVSGGGLGSPLTITFNGTQYAFTTASVFASLSHDTLDISAYQTGGASCEIMLKNIQQQQTVGMVFPSIFLSLNSVYYGSTSGTITVTVVSGNNTQGTFSAKMANYVDPSDTTKIATGSFNVTHQ